MAKQRKQGRGSRRGTPKSADAPLSTATESATSGSSAPANAATAKPQSGTTQPPPGDAATKADRPLQFSVPAELVEHILLGPVDDRRVLQDSPLLGDVWAAYALDPGLVQDVLITPHKNVTAAAVAQIIPRGIDLRQQERQAEDPPPSKRPKVRAKVAYLQGLVGARLYFDEVLRILVPLTQWWSQSKLQERILKIDQANLHALLQREPDQRGDDQKNFTSLERYIALAGLIYWIGKLERPTIPGSAPPEPVPHLPRLQIDEAFRAYLPHVPEIIAGMFELYGVIQANPKALASGDPDDDEAGSEGYIFQVSLNRVAAAALDRSVPAVKADAAHSLFNVNCKNIIWAVLDSGIDADHEAFAEHDNPDRSRVRKTFDFTRIREIVSNDEDDIAAAELEDIANAAGIEPAAASNYLKEIAANARAKRPINWGVVEKLITLKNPPQPVSLHGTHVAGIIGADGSRTNHPDGMCPDIRIYDFRVLGKTIDDTEFAVIAALQYIRYVNERHNYITIHGANLSLSIPHNVRNYACGRTPVCNECERLVESGVVVVAAAGNRGFQKLTTTDGGVFESYAAFSITDPGNSESVITVGSTHGNWPHTYGVSFFSSRGPTGDGRLKPDLVAPGERVQSCIIGGNHQEWGPESGTSMAAPHVSGAAAMLLARYEELIGQPRRVKRILCESATDLGRERSFQGHGMLDVLRAFQSI
ncbi:S8 family peptidase [Bradyrhizobium sp. 195]|uniref:S8 family peptidase n=1 Tax=Bradyrhizobium sp. 195 TaxID=2782662 RepID=UPI002001CAD2|nr:S8 family peptidase [Bradyrhizobium sp. 195]